MERTKTHTRGSLQTAAVSTAARFRFATSLSVGLIATSVGCGNPANFDLSSATQEFQQEHAKTNNLIDILWVVDNSGSMEPFQKNLTDNFASFMAEFQNKGFDYQMAVTTTDAYLASRSHKSDLNIGKFKDGNKEKTTGHSILTPSTPDLMQTFITNATQGIKGSGDERPFESLLETLKNPLNEGFLRKGAFLAVIILADEDDFSDQQRPEHSWLQRGGVKDHDYNNPSLLSVESVLNELDLLTSSTPQEKNFSVSAITALDDQCKDAKGNTVPKASRIMQLVEGSKGTLGHICDRSFASALNFIQRKIVELATQFRIGRHVDPDTIVVIVDGQVVPRDPQNGWSYVPETTAIQFHGSAVPGPGAAIRIQFARSDLKNY